MSDPILQISCSIGTTDSSALLGFEVRLDNQVIFNQDHVTELHTFTYNMPDVNSTHCLEFVMKNKTQAHTKIDADNNIVKDACLTILNLTFNEIELKQLLINQAVYTHDFNGTQSEVKDKFYGIMGCNGRVSLNFSTPVHLWLLENM